MRRNTVLHWSSALMMIIILTLVNACSPVEMKKKPSTGAVNELLIVTNDKVQWEGAPGDTIRAFFAAEQPGLPQPEPVFDLVNVANKDFQEIFQKFHNIFIMDINPDYPVAASETRQDVWSGPQRVITVTAPDLNSFYTEFNHKKEAFLKIFIDLERKRTLTINKLTNDTRLSEIIEKKMGISIAVPEGFYLAKETGDFIWLRHKLTKAKKDVELGIMIYTMGYRDTMAFNPRHIIQWRNALTLQYVPGPSPLSYMKVLQEYIPPIFETLTDFPGGYAVETRGLWEVENDFMGGPFISYTFLDKSSDRVVTLDGYIYNPNDAKKGYLRQIEAIFWDVKYVEPQ